MTDQTAGLWNKLSQLQYLLHRRYAHRRSSPTADATRGQGRILAFLKLREGIATKDLAYLLDIRISSLNELLAKLERNGYLRREPSEADRRVMLLYLTEKGRAEEQPELEQNGVLDCLSPEEQEHFGGYLDRIIAAWRRSWGRATAVGTRNASGWHQEASDHFHGGQRALANHCGGAQNGSGRRRWEWPCW